jgi:hypothetical protein
LNFEGLVVTHEWLDGTTKWVLLSESKELHPLQVVEYAVSNIITFEPALA